MLASNPDKKMKLLYVHTPSHEKLVKEYFLPSLQPEYELIQYSKNQFGSGQFMGEDWSRAVLFKCECIIDAIRQNIGDVFVYSDVDLQYFGPTKKHLLKAIENCDIACQLDDPSGNFCTGFFVVKASQCTLSLWEDVRRAIISEGRDQLAFNRLARNTDHLRVTCLPTRFFGAGTFSARLVTAETVVYVPPAPLMFHANWTVGLTNKLALLERVRCVVNGGLAAITYNNWEWYRNTTPKRLDRLQLVYRDAIKNIAVTHGLHVKDNDKKTHNALNDTLLPPTTLPKSVCLELSSACQLKCPSCPNANGVIAKKLGSDFLSYDNFRHFLDCCHEINHIELSNWGELFLNKSLQQILRFAYDRGVALSADNGVNLNTVDNDILEALVKYRFRRITCSIDGITQGTYERYRINGKLDAVLANIREINRYKSLYSSIYPLLRWQFVAFGHNQDDISEARHLAKELGMDFYLKLSWDDMYTEKSFSPITNHDLIRTESGLGVADRKEFRQLYGKSYISDTCRQLWNMPHIHADGRMLGCCINFWGNYGNVFETGFFNCFFGEKMSYARAMVDSNVPARSDIPCSQCKVYHEMHQMPASPQKGAGEPDRL